MRTWLYYLYLRLKFPFDNLFKFIFFISTGSTKTVQIEVIVSLAVKIDLNMELFEQSECNEYTLSLSVGSKLNKNALSWWIFALV